MHGLVGQALAEQHHVGPQETTTMGAFRRDRQAGVVLHLTDSATIHTAQASQGAMHLDDIPGASLQVETIHVLGQGGHLAMQGFKAGNRIVTGIGPGTPAAGFDLRQVAPGDVGPGAENFTGQGLLDGQPNVGEGPFIQAADAPVGGQAGIG